MLVPEMEGRGPIFPFARVVTYTPKKYAQPTQLVERITMVLSLFSIDFVLPFVSSWSTFFFVKTTLFVDEKSTLLVEIFTLATKLSTRTKYLH